MLALFGNIAPLEIIVILGLAIVVFGARLPEVAGKAYAQFRRMRESMDRFRRDTGIDRELREIERNVRDAAWRKDLRSSLEPPTSRPVPAEESGVPHAIERTDVGIGRETRDQSEEPTTPNEDDKESTSVEPAGDPQEKPASD